MVVYKVDRLSRSLIDFAHIIEIFDKHNVSFVSVTQQFNTTNSLGRLTLNILLSFAQFEREIIAERTRDKMSAARRKGKWIGGRPVLGYDIDPRSSRLIVNGDEAIQVRMIFKLYLDYNTLMPVVREIDRRGWRTKQWVTKKGVTHGGKRFTKGRLFRLLTNPIYIGKIDFEKQITRVNMRQSSRPRSGSMCNRSSVGMAVMEAPKFATATDTAQRATTLRLLQRRHGTNLHDEDNSRRFTLVCPQGKQGQPRLYVNPRSRRRWQTGSGGLASDPRIVVRTMANAEEQRRNNIAALTLEREVARRALAGMETELRKLPPLVDCCDQTPTESAIAVNEHIGQAERRLKDLSQELASSRKSSGGRK